MKLLPHTCRVYLNMSYALPNSVSLIQVGVIMPEINHCDFDHAQILPVQGGTENGEENYPWTYLGPHGDYYYRNCTYSHTFNQYINRD